MIRMYIELDKEKIERERKYDYVKLQNGIDEIFAAHGSYKDSEGWYTNGTWEDFMALAANFAKSDQFLDNTKKMLWNNTDYEEEPGDVCVEDMLKEFRDAKRRGKI